MKDSEREREFDAFVGARSAALLRTAYLVTGHRQTAEDLLQTALAKTYLAWNRIDSPESVEAYVRRVMVTTHVSWWRRHKGREQTTDPQLETDRTRRTEGVPSAHDAVDERDRLWAALRGLTDRQRTVLVLRYYEDLSEEEIAHLMGCSRGTVKTHASRGLGTLRARLAADDAADLDRTGGAR